MDILLFAVLYIIIGVCTGILYAKNHVHKLNEKAANSNSSRYLKAFYSSDVRMILSDAFLTALLWPVYMITMTFKYIKKSFMWLLVKVLDIKDYES